MPQPVVVDGQTDRWTPPPAWVDQHAVAELLTRNGIHPARRAGCSDLGADSRCTVRYTHHVQEWDVYVVHDVREWIDELDAATHRRVVQAIDALAEAGPGLGRPLVDTIKGTSIANLKGLRVSTARILFVFDPWRACVLLVAGDKSGRWNAWYEEAIPTAEHRYQTYLKERARDDGLGEERQR
jgi:hypothetical protein